MKQDKWYSPKNKLPPHNLIVLNEYGCVVTYNHKTKKWKDSYGRVVNPKVWKYKEQENESTKYRSNLGR